MVKVFEAAFRRTTTQMVTREIKADSQGEAEKKAEALLEADVLDFNDDTDAIVEEDVVDVEETGEED